MKIVIRISDELAAQAQAHGVRPEAYVEEILSRQMETLPSASQLRRTAKEIRAWLDSLAQFSDNIRHYQKPSRENGFTRPTIEWPFPLA